jgi:YD repeat-containing protein
MAGMLFRSQSGRALFVGGIVRAFVPATVLAAMVLAPAALAQDARLLAPAPAEARDLHGVDLLGGSFSDAPVSITAGPAEAGVTFQPVMTDRGYWRNNLAGAVVQTCDWNYDVNECETQPHLTVSLGALAGTVFEQQPSGAWSPSDGVSVVLTGSGSSWTYTAHDGSVATYALPAVWDYNGAGDGPYPPRQTGLASIQSLRRPNGLTLNYRYRETAPGVSVLSSVTSNTGYQVFFEYAGTFQPVMTKAVALNNAVESCAPTASSCSPVGSWPTLTFSETTDSRSVTDSLDRTTFYNYGAPQGQLRRRVTGVRRPGRPTGENLALLYRQRVDRNVVPPWIEPYGPVRQVTTDDGAWSYRFSTSLWPAETQVTNPASGVFFYQNIPYGVGESRRLVSIKDPLGNVTANAYDYRAGLGPVLTSVVQPEGNRIFYNYDARGNVTERRTVSKTPGTPADIVETAVYPATCANPLTCNSPTRTTDARGGVTDYTYDAAGNLLTVTGPPPTSGAPRPQTRYVWEQRYAWYKQNGSTAITQAPTTVWVQVSQSQCVTGATC